MDPVSAEYGELNEWVSATFGELGNELASVSDGHEEKEAVIGDAGTLSSGGLGFPRMAERMEYSRLAASEPKLNVESKAEEKRVSSGKGSARSGIGCVGGGGGGGGSGAAGGGGLTGVGVVSVPFDLRRFSSSSSSSSKRYFAFLRCPSVQVLSNLTQR